MQQTEYTSFKGKSQLAGIESPFYLLPFASCMLASKENPNNRELKVDSHVVRDCYAVVGFKGKSQLAGIESSKLLVVV